MLGLGTYAPGTTHDVATVDGNIVAHSPASLYISRTTVHGNVVSNGGGDPVRNFPIKDDTIDGNVIVQGWHGGWVGVIRVDVGGNGRRPTAAQPASHPPEGAPEMKRPSLLWSLFDGLTHAVDRAVHWHRLPTPPRCSSALACRRSAT